VRCLWAKELNTECIRKEIFSVYGGTCLSHKVVHSWVKQRIADGEEVGTEMGKWLRQQSTDFHAVGFDALVKRWDGCFKTDGRSVEK
jgi:hypothetical protein